MRRCEAATGQRPPRLIITEQTRCDECFYSVSCRIMLETLKTEGMPVTYSSHRYFSISEGRRVGLVEVAGEVGVGLMTD